MLRLRVLPLLSVVVFASCVEPDSALRVDVVVKDVGGVRVRADCLRIQVLDEKNAVLGQSVFARPQDDTAVIAIRRGKEFPRDVGLRVQGLQGRCDDESTLKLNAQSDVVQASFPERGFSTVAIELGPPNSALDGDRDGWVDANKGGPDCDDSDRTIFPGGTQVCAVQKDTDCDGFIGCDDSECTTASVCANPPTRLVITSMPALEMSRHTCIGPFVAELRNADGVRTAIRNTTVNVASSVPGLTFHPTCNDTSTDFTIAYGASQFSFYAKADGAVRGLVTVTATADRVPTPATVQLKVKALPVAKIVITSPERTVTAGSCSTQTIDFELFDSMNRHTDADDDAIVFNLSAKLGAATVADLLFSDGMCGTVAPTLNFPSGVGNASLRVSNTRAGTYEVTAVRGAISATQNVTVTPAAPNKLQLLNAFLVLTPQVCSNGGFGVELVDAFGNAAPAPANSTLTVEQESTIEGVTFHSAVDCLPPATSTVEFTAGQSQRFIPTRGTLSRTGRARVTTNIPGVLMTDWLNVSVGVGALTYFDLSGPGQTITANGCSVTPMSFVARDVAGNPTLAPDGGVTIDVNASLPGGDLRFFTTSGCPPANGRADVFVPGGAPDVRVYFSGTRARPAFAFTGTNATYPVDGGVSGNVITPAAPTKFFVNPDAGVTTAASCTQFTGSFFDTWDNATGYTNDRQVTVMPGTLTVSPTGACGGGMALAPANQSTFDFFVGSNTAGVYPMTVNVGALSANARLTVNPGMPQLSASTATPNVRAGECVNIALERRDGQLNPTPVTTTTSFPVTAGARTYVFAQGNCMGAVDAGATMNAGQNTATFSVRPIAAVPQNVVIDALGGTNPQVALTVQPNVTTRYEWASAGTPLALTAGACSPALTVTRYDAWDNLVTQGNETPALTSMNLVQFFNTSGCTAGSTITTALVPDGQGVSSTFYARGTSADAGVMRADLNAANGTRAVAVSPSTAHHLAFATAPGSTQAGTCEGDVRVDLRDEFENRVQPAGTVSVSLSTDGGVGQSGGPVLFSDIGCNTGISSVELTAGAPVASFRFRSIRATPPGPPLALIARTASPVTSTASQGWVVTPRDVARLGWTEATPATVNRFECTRLGPVRTEDTFGNVVAPTSTLALQGPLADANLGAQFFSDAQCTAAVPASIATGTTTSQPYYVVATGADAGTVIARSATGSIVSPAITLSLVGTPGSLTVSDAGFVEASACRPVTVARLDGSGSAVTKGETSFILTSASASVTLHPTPDCAGAGSATVNGAFMAGQSTVTYYLRGRSSNGAETVPVTVTDVLGGSTGSSTDATALPLVRRGSCNIADNASNSRCELSPPLPGNDLSRSFLLFSSTGGDASASLSNVACKLDATTNAAVVCNRAGDGAAPAGDQSLLIEYQVVSYGRSVDAGGITVQHVPSGVTDSSGSFPVTIAPVPTGESFVLFSTYGTGSENGADDFPTMHLENGTTLRVLSAGAKNYEAQVVSISGAQVDRGEAVLDAGVFFTQVPGIPAADVSRAFLLYSVRGVDRPDGGVQEMCKRQVRGGFDGGAVYFARGFNAATECGVDPVQIRWEAVRLPAASAQQQLVSVAGSGGGLTRTSNFNFAAVVLNRSVGFVGGQGPGGQSMGEGNFFDATGGNGDTVGSFRSALRFNSTTQGVLECRNSGAGKDSQFNPFVVQFAP